MYKMYVNNRRSCVAGLIWTGAFLHEMGGMYILGDGLLCNRVWDAVGASGDFSRSSSIPTQELLHVLLL